MQMKVSLKNEKEGINYLDLIPEKTGKCTECKQPDETLVLEVENKGVFNTIAQKLFKKPRKTKIHLDEMGNFIWPLIDGKHSVAEIANLVKGKFGEKANPLYLRLVKYFQILESYDFVSMKGK